MSGPSRGDYERRISDLEEQGDQDRQTIRDLRKQTDADQLAIHHLEIRAGVDQSLIQQLVAEGDVDRAKIANLETALVSARRIGAAMGVLMATHKITDADAFELLRAASQRDHRKLRDIAEDVLLTGALPADSAPPAPEE